MLEYSFLKLFDENVALRWHGQEGGMIEEFLYRHIREASVQLLRLIYSLLPNLNRLGEEGWQSLNVAIQMSHSPLVLPAIIGYATE